MWYLMPRHHGMWRVLCFPFQLLYIRQRDWKKLITIYWKIFGSRSPPPNLHYWSTLGKEWIQQIICAKKS